MALPIRPMAPPPRASALARPKFVRSVQVRVRDGVQRPAAERRAEPDVVPTRRHPCVHVVNVWVMCGPARPCPPDRDAAPVSEWTPVPYI